MSETKEVIELAKEYRHHFKKRERSDGEEFFCLSDDAPEELETLVEEVHGDFLPDDWRYRFIWESLIQIGEAEPEDEPLEDLYQWIEADIYTSDLLKWFGSNTQRIGYVDEARNEYGCEHLDSVVDEIRVGQEREKHEVFFSVLNSLKEQVTEQ